MKLSSFQCIKKVLEAQKKIHKEVITVLSLLGFAFWFLGYFFFEGRGGFFVFVVVII